MKRRSKMLIKTVVALVGIALTVSVLFFTPPWGTAILLSFLSIMSCYELMIPTGVVKNRIPVICCLITSALVPWIWLSDDLKMVAVLFFLCLLVLIAVLWLYFAATGQFHKTGTISYLFTAAIVFPSFFSLLLPVLNGQNGKQLVLIPFIAAWSSDTGAQFAGKLFGKRKLAPQISPNKTVEGLFGGIFGGVLGMAVYALVLVAMKRHAPWISMLVFGVLGATFGTVGDLFFSYVKREHGLKDFGALMPEHGGVLDRFDSVVFVIPLFYAYMQFFPVI